MQAALAFIDDDMTVVGMLVPAEVSNSHLHFQCFVVRCRNAKCWARGAVAGTKRKRDEDEDHRVYVIIIIIIFVTIIMIFVILLSYLACSFSDCEW